jgi:hypothetical protein
MQKTILTIAAVVFVTIVVGIVVLVAPFMYLGVKSRQQQQALQNRTDFSEIARAGVRLARSFTNDNPLVFPTNSLVPPLLRSLSPRYFSVESNRVTMEFHGGFDHYGYHIRQSGTNPALWSISWYTEHGERFLTNILSGAEVSNQ